MKVLLRQGLQWNNGDILAKIEFGQQKSYCEKLSSLQIFFTYVWQEKCKNNILGLVKTFRFCFQTSNKLVLNNANLCENMRITVFLLHMYRRWETSACWEELWLECGLSSCSSSSPALGVGPGVLRTNGRKTSMMVRLRVYPPNIPSLYTLLICPPNISS